MATEDEKKLNPPVQAPRNNKKKKKKKRLAGGYSGYLTPVRKTYKALDEAGDTTSEPKN